MSLPPVIVQIKRKATDEPVELLRIHELDNPAKRRRPAAADFVFSRQSTPDISITQSTSPAVRKIKELHRSSSSQALATSSAPNSRSDTPVPRDLDQRDTIPSAAFPPVHSAPPTPAPEQSRSSKPRHFHISRSSTPSLLDPTKNTSRKRKGDATLFIERRPVAKSQEGQHQNNVVTTTATKSTETLPPQKRPGRAARSSTPPVKNPAPKPAVAPLRNVRMPSGAIIPWDVSSERLAAEMQAYTLQEIGKNIADSEAQRPEPKHISSNLHKSTPSKFKPKAPALRYAQRHPEEKLEASNGVEMDLDGPYVEEAMDDETEYVIDTYIRMPADALETQGTPSNIGFLILDSQPDIDEFYREEEDSDEEEDDGDEDENAENHYTADYPDEEVDSDDEFGRNAYNYRTHNASDLEEFDEADKDMTFSDDENERTKYPWMQKKPWLQDSKNGFSEANDEVES